MLWTFLAASLTSAIACGDDEGTTGTDDGSSTSADDGDDDDSATMTSPTDPSESETDTSPTSSSATVTESSSEGSSGDTSGSTGSTSADSSGSDDSGSSGASSDESSTTEAACVPITEDGSAIGQNCMGAPCPEDYTCQDINGFQFQQLCAILCEEDCECPEDHSCQMQQDKINVWTECRPV